MFLMPPYLGRKMPNIIISRDRVIVNQGNNGQRFRRCGLAILDAIAAWVGFGSS
jgi:hypothetical protein